MEKNGNRLLDKLKEVKGITLIALVITIIVLLILAGVSIAALSGNNGILTKASESKTTTAEESAKEAVEMVLDEWQIENYTGSQTLEQFLNSKIPSNLDKVTKKEDGTFEIEKDDYIITVNADGKITKVEKAGPRAKISNVKITLEDGVTVPEDESQPIGTKLKITFDSNIEGGTIKSIEPSLPYTTTGNEKSKTFTIIGTVNGVDYSVERTVNIENKYQIEESEKIVKVIDKSTTKYANKDSVKEVRKGNIPIPIGFNYVKGSKVGGAVISDGTNQFVWVPVEGTYERNKTYASTDVSTTAYDDDDSESYLPTGITNEKTAVENAGGFYISRYEAGKPEGAINGTTAPISQKGAAVWTNISYRNGDVKRSAKAMYNNANVKSSVLTGIQWDMTMVFINGKKDGNGKTYNVTASDSTRHISSGGVTIAGNNIADKVANIYDLEGNAYEYVAEKNTFNLASTYVCRGGSCRINYSTSYRSYNLGHADSSGSFRLALYVAL